MCDACLDAAYEQVDEKERENTELRRENEKLQSDTSEWQRAFLDSDNRLYKIIRWLEDNDHRLPDGGDALWEIIHEEEKDDV